MICIHELNKYKSIIKNILDRKSSLKTIISDIQYSHPSNTTVTVCTITIFGFHIVASKICIFKDKDNKKLGEQYAYEAAELKAFGLLAFLYSFLEFISLDKEDKEKTNNNYSMYILLKSFLDD